MNKVKFRKDCADQKQPSLFLVATLKRAATTIISQSTMNYPPRPGLNQKSGIRKSKSERDPKAESRIRIGSCFPNRCKHFVAALVSVILAASHLMAAEPATLTVHADSPGAKINPAMWGIFFEDINFGADGGLYAELVKNRSFEFPDPRMGWSEIKSESASGRIEIRDQDPFDSNNPHYARIIANDHSSFGIANEGFRGMGVRAGETYNFSAQIRAASNAPTLRIELVDADGNVLSSTRVKNISGQWSQRKATLKPNATAAKAHLNVIAEGSGALDLDMVSLFPEKTWKRRANGLRADMVQLLADLKPGFLRFPGGCIVEGSDLSKRYQWKNTIGPIADRKLIINRWNYEFKHRPTPDYFQSFGLGFFEYFQLCEDLGAEPLPILNCGMACQFNTGQLVPLNELDPYIQDALDLIEFANGPVTSEWGAKRAAMGHPKPFNMKLLGIGNEQWGPQYLERYPLFAKVIKEKHPEIQLISSAGPSPGDDRFHFLEPKLRELRADIVDEHCYGNPIWFLANAHRYDHYDRNGPKIFMGEYAAQSVAIVSPDNKNNLDCALAEAAYMTGLERNADVVRMASYAPLFGHIDAWQWTPNLIWTDNLRVEATPNYYVQQLFSVNRGDAALPVTLSGVEMKSAPAGGIGIGTYHTAAEFKDVRVTANGRTLLQSDFTGDSGNWKTKNGQWAIRDGAWEQSDARATASAFIGEADWQNYTITLKARKLRGAEGFLITIRQQGPENYVVWNLGSFGNQFHSLQQRLGQQDQLIARTPGSIEANRWYDIKVQLTGERVDCYLDGQLIQSAEIPSVTTQTLYASAVRDDNANEIILKIVNPGDEANALNVNLAGIKRVKSKAAAMVLTSGDRSDVNTLDKPDNVVPKKTSVTISGPQFEYDAPARSLSVIRIPAR